MKTRALTGVCIAVAYATFILASIYVPAPFGNIAFDLFVLGLMIVGGIEMSRAVATRYGKPMIFFVVINVVTGYVAFMIFHHTGQFGRVSNNVGGVTAFFGQLFFIFLLCILYNMIAKKDIGNIFSTMFVLVYPVSLMVYMIAINYINENLRVMAIILVFLISSFTDIFAYFVGSAVKGPKLAPNISPKKTVSGAMGGLFGGIVAGVTVLIFGSFGILRVELFGSRLEENLMHLLFVGVLGAAVNQFGDLVASFIKRACRVKDFGNVLPGHGGVMDRVDGMMIVAVVVYAYMGLYDILTPVLSEGLPSLGYLF